MANAGENQAAGEWVKVDAKDRMAPWNWQIKAWVGTLEESVIADHLNEGNADRIIADHEAAARVPALSYQLRWAWAHLGCRCAFNADHELTTTDSHCPVHGWQETLGDPEGWAALATTSTVQAGE